MEPLASVTIGSPVIGIGRTDDLDVIIVGVDDPSVPRLQSREPLALDYIDSETTGWGPIFLRLLPWNTGGLAYTVQDDELVSYRVGADGLLNGVYDGSNHLCPDDELLAEPAFHSPEHGSAAFRSLYPEGLVYVGGGRGCGIHAPIAAFDRFALSNLRWWYAPSEPLEAIYELLVDPVRDVLFASIEHRDYWTSLVAINVLDGSELWRVEGDRIRGLGRRGDRLYAVTQSNGIVEARSALDGSLIWSAVPASGWPVVTDLIVPLEPPYHDAIITRDILGGVHLFQDLGSSGTLVWTAEDPDTLASRAHLAFDSGSGTVFSHNSSGVIHEIDAATGSFRTSYPADSVSSPLTAMLLTWPFDDDGNMGMYAANEQGTLSRLCVSQGDVVRNREFGPIERIGTGFGYPSFEDTDTGNATILLLTLDDLDETVGLSRYEVVATRDVWSDPGPCHTGRLPMPCFQDMEFILMAWEPGVQIEGDIRDAGNPGKVYHVDVTDRLTVVPSYAVSQFIVGTEPALLSFDLAGLGIQIPPGGRVGVMGRGSVATVGRFSVATMTQGAERDSIYQYPQEPSFWTSVHAAVRVLGRNELLAVGETPRPSVARLTASPNPFHGTTTINVHAGTEVSLSVTVFDVAGRRVEELFQGRTTGAELQVRWSPEQLLPGVYFVRTKIGAQVVTSKVTLTELR